MINQQRFNQQSKRSGLHTGMARQEALLLQHAGESYLVTQVSKRTIQADLGRRPRPFSERCARTLGTVGVHRSKRRKQTVRFIKIYMESLL
ncbi:hypothetical protein T08_16605 [Trichinella sp. T8]|nr:hypothetical protein T08_16605 [Trichinella sp. T8]